MGGYAGEGGIVRGGRRESHYRILYGYSANCPLRKSRRVEGADGEKWGCQGYLT